MDLLTGHILALKLTVLTQVTPVGLVVLKKRYVYTGSMDNTFNYVLRIQKKVTMRIFLSIFGHCAIKLKRNLKYKPI